MRTRAVLGLVVLATLTSLAVHPSAAPLPPACVVVDQEPLHAQVGYAPNGPEDCTRVP